MTAPKRKFFVFSLPRSGSTWLSNYLSMPGSWCYHEPLVCGMTFPALLARMEERPEPAVGAIDTVFHNRLPEPVDGARYFVIRRDLESVFQSQVRALMLNLDGSVRDQARRLDEAAEQFEAIDIHHARFHDEEYMREVWDMVTGQPFDEERASYLSDYVIQHKPIAIHARRSGFKKQ